MCCLGLGVTVTFSEGNSKNLAENRNEKYVDLNRCLVVPVLSNKLIAVSSI